MPGIRELADKFGTEEDQVNCPFYFKIGACRHGDTCKREHHKPPFSQTIVLKHMYYNPMIPHVNSGASPESMDKTTMQEVLDDFLEEIVEECGKYGKLEDVQVLENLGEHMIGNVYVKYDDEEEAAEALEKLNGRYFAGRVLEGEYTHVTDFREARCRKFDDGHCERGAFCNFMHVGNPSSSLRKYLDREFRFRGCRAKGNASMATMGGDRR